MRMNKALIVGLTLCLSISTTAEGKDNMMSKPEGFIYPEYTGKKTTPPSQRLHLILLGVQDVALSRAFYERLGWIQSPTSEEEFTKIDMGGYALALMKGDDFATEIFGEEQGKSHSWPRPAYTGTVFAHLVKTPEDVPKLLARALDAGATLVKPVSRTHWGINAFFKDPDGYLFEIDYEDVWVFDNEHKLLVDQKNK